MFDLGNFANKDMNDCAIALRNMDANARSMEEVAERMVRYLYENLIDPQTNESACALVRFFRTYPYRQLNEELQESAREILGGRSIALGTKCLTLLATAGDEPHWNLRRESSGHRAIPLVDKDFIERAPMISQLIQQFGLEITAVLEPDPELLVDLYQTNFNVFYVPDALGSAHIPAQKDFVIPYGIKSVVGFGGMLPSGNLFAIILFSKVPISRSTADLFKWVSSYARIATATFDKRAVFANALGTTAASA
ncbi:MAG: hypothetical protein KME15_04000 [Drouetiella hepatica Uher 2000/2452]|jgi:hypothetical protein|uniref:Uncharacterized protein n=1 Tax=Drouetiella hepatica Uher 2000/2452 TaxID=904376 RepID=A0A951Q7N9_9CYAN|nr:hypothetical protein [Drouetiella hepatica Uher 2000/2452]